MGFLWIEMKPKAEETKRKRSRKKKKIENKKESNEQKRTPISESPFRHTIYLTGKATKPTKDFRMFIASSSRRDFVVVNICIGLSLCANIGKAQ